MGRALRTDTFVAGRWFAAGTTPPDDYAQQITNSKAWEDSDMTDTPTGPEPGTAVWPEGRPGPERGGRGDEHRSDRGNERRGGARGDERRSDRGNERGGGDGRHRNPPVTEPDPGPGRVPDLPQEPDPGPGRVPELPEEPGPGPGRIPEPGQLPAPTPAPAPTPLPAQTQGTAPPRSGRGSGTEAWETFARANGVQLPDGFDRADIITACEQAGLVEPA